MSLSVVRQAGKVFDCPSVLKGSFAYAAWSVGPPCGYRLRRLIWICWIVLFAVRKGCVRVSLVLAL